ncbi:advanced glycosylation end product-specific receptor [Mirounga angustirostris]|uniref:advanced glycosylation end product-specific receptor n=1 Tax=Mirounga angustirostris TaxID=9716 RepID=UPI0023E42934|nr:advanced glycosylation end product-specific receptor [Mirounga angustirostris]
MAGVPNKVGTCVSEGGYPAGTLNWHSDGKPLIPDGKGVSVQEETRRHPETGLFTLQSELMVTPAWGGALHPTFSCSFSPGLPRRRALHTAPIQLRVWGEWRPSEREELSPWPLRPHTGITLNFMPSAPEPVPPEVQVMVQPEGGKVVPGGTVTLTCETPTQSSLQIHWIKDGMPLHLPPSPVLLLHEVQHEDQGTYSCVATHPSHGPQESPAVRVVIEAEEGPIAGEGLEADGPNVTGGWMVNKKGMVSGGGPRFSPSLYRLCGRAGTGNCSPRPGDPGRPGDSRPAHWGHHVAKTATSKREEEGLRKPGGGGGARRAESARGARSS